MFVLEIMKYTVKKAHVVKCFVTNGADVTLMIRFCLKETKSIGSN